MRLARQVKQRSSWLLLCRRLNRQWRTSCPPPASRILLPSSASSPSSFAIAHLSRGGTGKTYADNIFSCSYNNNAGRFSCNQRMRCRSPISTRASGCQTENGDKKQNALVISRSDGCSKQLGSNVKSVGAPQAFWTKVRKAAIAPFSMSRNDILKKLAQWKSEAIITLKNYWVGTKLLWTDVRISSRLLLKLASGKKLTRRERQQLTRTSADMFRLVPFAIIIVVPFMEFTIPVFLKFFPNMLPSMFRDKIKQEEAQQRILNARIQYAKFLQDTVKEMAKEIKTARSGDIQTTAEDLDNFMNRVRTGEKVSNEDILRFAKLFNDEITLDNLSRPRLISMCKYMGIKPYGTNSYLGYMLRSKLTWIKNDDALIKQEGIELLSEAELQAACRERGILNAFTVDDMRQQLNSWLDLSLNHSVPSSLLILSRLVTF
ncbi:hypothetical protein KP509_35G053400 [Ceratopteris richardii]|uniref:Letm1 RBD domain-containing protein n=1 Tax=Ceratopteris richardii TaxID=49495 RepID=A0A8T2QI84_CERRI|nr:hypothetical protein KP509_35G053400 [Ceratopteris richardii]